MRQNPGITQAERSMTYPMRGIIQSVRYRNTARGKRTAVDILLLDRTGQSSPESKKRLLTHVPLLYPKMNDQNGEEWTPETGDLVAIGFFNANLRDPFVMGYLGTYDGDTMDDGSDPHPQSYRRRSGTWERIDKDGNRETEIAVDEDINIKGKRTTIIEGHETVTITSGDISVSVSSGKCTVQIAGKTAWTSNGGIDLDGGPGDPQGNVQGDCICAFTGKPHPMRSQTVRSSL